MADFFECSSSSFYRWTAAHPKFREAIKTAKDGPDDAMERSLFHRGRGFEWIEQQAIKLREETWVNGNKEVSERVEVVDVRKIVPPDSTAAIFWLKNRRGWKDKSEVDHGVTDALADLIGKPLVAEYVANTLLGIEFLWGKPVELETSEPEIQDKPDDEDHPPEIVWHRVLYRMEKRKLTKKKL
jgi:hypothetical protein